MNYTLFSLILFQIFQLALALSGVTCSKRRINMILIIQVLSIAFFYGMRGLQIGADTDVYVSSYLNNHYWMEPGFVIYSNLAKIILRDSWELYLTSISFIILLCLALFYKQVFKNENYKFLNIAFFLTTLMPYFILMQTNIIRQGMAIAILLLGFVILLVNNKKYGLMFIFISWTFHYSMIFISMIVLIIYFVRLNKTYTLVLIVFSFIFYLLNTHQIVFQMIDNGYLAQRIFEYQSLQTNNSVLIKFAFYLINYLMISYYSKFVKDRIYHVIEKVYSGILLGASLILFTDVTASRIMGNLDFILPIIYIYPLFYIKTKRLGLYTITVMFLYYLVNLFSTTMKINFQLF